MEMCLYFPHVSVEAHISWQHSFTFWMHQFRKHELPWVTLLYASTFPQSHIYSKLLWIQISLSALPLPLCQTLKRQLSPAERNSWGHMSFHELRSLFPPPLKSPSWVTGTQPRKVWASSTMSEALYPRTFLCRCRTAWMGRTSHGSPL